MRTAIDVIVRKEGSLFLFYPQNKKAKKWIKDNVSGESTWFGGGLVVESHYAYELAKGMMNEGLNIK